MRFDHRYNFSDGQINATSDVGRPSTAVRELVNGSLRTEGGISKRSGFRTVLTSIGASIGLGEASLIVSNTLTNFLFAISGTGLTRNTVQKDGTAATSTLTVTGGDPAFGTFCRILSMNGIVSGTKAKQVLFVGSEEVPIRYDGTNTTRIALDAPGAPTVAVGVAGVLTGTYSYKVTFVNDFGETSAGTASANVAPVAEKVDISAIPTGSTTEPYAVRYRKIYRTEAGGSTYKLLTTITDNTTTTYTDNIADGALGATPPSINRCSKIPRGVDGSVFQSRMYIGNNKDANTNGVNFYPWRVWFSVVDDCLDFSAVDQDGVYFGYFDLPTLEAITGMVVVGTRLIIFTARSMWAWDGYRIIEISRAVGTPSGGTIGQGDQYIYFLDFSGVYRFNGGVPNLVSRNIDKSIRGIQTFSSCRGTVFNNQYFLLCGTVTDTVNGIDLTQAILVYDEIGNRWATWTVNASNTISSIGTYAYRSAGTIEETLLYIGFNGSALYQHHPSIFTDGTTTGSFTARPTQFSVTTGPIFSGNPHLQKRYSLFLMQSKFGAGTNVFYRNLRTDDYKPLGTANQDTFETTLEDGPETSSDGYFMDTRITNSERGQPFILEGFSYALADEASDIADD